MAQFLKPEALKKEITELFTEAEKFLLIVSPYIHIPENLRRVLAKRLDDKELEVYVIFGKNEHDISRSLKTDDMDFLKQFQNIEIHYHPDLHAKFYANDFGSIVTSMNLHRHSLQRNIEVGVKFEQKFSLLGREDNDNDVQSTDYFMTLIEGQGPMFKRHVSIKKTLLGFKKERGESNVEIDETALFKKSGRKERPEKTGYCIRTGVEIPFDIQRPMSEKAYMSWRQFGNEDYPEQYCHYSGEYAPGGTSYGHPILKKNWKFVSGKA